MQTAYHSGWADDEIDDARLEGDFGLDAQLEGVGVKITGPSELCTVEADLIGITGGLHRVGRIFVGVGIQELSLFERLIRRLARRKRTTCGPKEIVDAIQRGEA